MTGIRHSFVFRRESSYAEDPYPTCDFTSTAQPITDDNLTWFQAPPGFWMEFTYNRSTAEHYGAGSKFFEQVSYGQVSGTWTATFPLTYEYLELLPMAFEGYTHTGPTTSQGQTVYKHTFFKKNGATVPSFCIRSKTLNQMAGGPQGSDELTYFKGCKVKEIRLSRSSSTSVAKITMSGIFADVKINKGSLVSTDYTEKTSNLVEFGCMFYNDAEDSDSKPIPFVDSITMAVNNGLNPLYAACTPVAQGTYEGQASFQFGMTTYANDPDRIKRRVLSGGYVPTIEGTTKLPGTTMHKKTKPVPLITVISYDGDTFIQGNFRGEMTWAQLIMEDSAIAGDLAVITDRDNATYICIEDYSSSETDKGSKWIPQSEYKGTTAVRSNYKASVNSAKYVVSDTVIKSVSWQKGDGSRMMDQISSAKCKNIQWEFTTTIADYADPAYAHTINTGE